MRRRLQRSRPAAAVLLVAIASLTLAGDVERQADGRRRERPSRKNVETQ